MNSHVSSARSCRLGRRFQNPKANSDRNWGLFGSIGGIVTLAGSEGRACRWNGLIAPISYERHRVPTQTIAHAVCLYDPPSHGVAPLTRSYGSGKVFDDEDVVRLEDIGIFKLVHELIFWS